MASIADITTVGQLKELLEQFDDDMEIVVSGYEGGYDRLRPDSIKPIRLGPSNHDRSWYGVYDTDCWTGPGALRALRDDEMEMKLLLRR